MQRASRHELLYETARVDVVGPDVEQLLRHGVVRFEEIGRHDLVELDQTAAIAAEVQDHPDAARLGLDFQGLLQHRDL